MSSHSLFSATHIYKTKFNAETPAIAHSEPAAFARPWGSKCEVDCQRHARRRWTTPWVSQRFTTLELAVPWSLTRHMSLHRPLDLGQSRLKSVSFVSPPFRGADVLGLDVR